MDKNAIKKYAVWARTELITRVSQRAEKYDITAEADVNASSVNGVLLSDAEKKQRKALIEQVKQKGLEQVMEEVAYTWFNRFIALRFMEVNGYLPSHIRVFTDDNNEFKPQILAEAIHLELDSLDMEKVYEMKNNNENDELYKYLIITQCNELSKVLPGMFPKISDYTELLFPDNVLREGSPIEQMVALIPEEDWKDQVQIVGWLYQYYNSEPKDQVFAALKKNVKISKENIPAATQLFTPDWIVRYMVDNSLGRIWINGHEHNSVKSELKYYVEDAEQEDSVQVQLDSWLKTYEGLKPEEIRCIDPCSGSGHILAYMFDVLIRIYEDYGVTTREAVRNIIQNNIWGLDIDDRASQLAYFSVMMKAIQYDRRFLSRKDEYGNPDVPQPHVYAIRESNNLDKHALEFFYGGNDNLQKNMETLIREMKDAKEYGSIIHVSEVNFSELYRRIDACKEEIHISKTIVEQELYPFIEVAHALAQKYHVVVTNPPYMGASGMSNALAEYVKNNYPNSKSDLFAVFIEKCSKMIHKNGYQAMITQHSWMFLGSYEKLRMKLLSNMFVNMAHLGARAFEEIGGEVVQTTSFVLCNASLRDYKAVFCRLVEPNSQDGKEQLFLSGDNRYCDVSTSAFSLIPGHPIAYWASKNLLSTFSEKKVSDYGDANNGFTTGNNNLFLRYWFEIDYKTIDFHAKNTVEAQEGKKKWFPYNKGGSYRKWFGNNDYVINWYNDGKDIKDYGHLVPRSMKYQFRKSISWSKVSTSEPSFKIKEEGTMFDVAGLSLFPFNNDNYYYLLALCNSSFAKKCLEFLSPTLNFETGHIASIPVIVDESHKAEIEELSKENISLVKDDWNSFELSWDFKKHPLINGEETIEAAYKKWSSICRERYTKLRDNEERINDLFRKIYKVGDEIEKTVNEKNVSIYQPNEESDVRSLISYAVGCIFGRYALDKEGVICTSNDSKYETSTSFEIDVDNIIPVTDDEYFSDDIVSRFIDFIKTVYGVDTLKQNLEYIANILGGQGTPSEVIRDYFINNFYSDHVKMYQKRPIYWMFDSGKKNGFKCLIYMHRYQADTIARIRTDYVHEQQSRYRTALEETENRLLTSSGSEKIKLDKKLKKLREQSLELHDYEEKIHHLADQMISIDLDDGFKNNYELFKDVVAPIK